MNKPDPVEQSAASPAQLSAREFYEKHWPHCVGYPNCDGDLEGMAHDPGCPLFEKDDKELFRLASMFSFAEAYRDASQRQPQSVSEEQLQKAADEIVLYLAKLHNAGMMNYVKPPTILSIMKSAFKEEL